MRPFHLFIFALLLCSLAPAQVANSSLLPLSRLEIYGGYLAMSHHGAPTFYNFNGFNSG